jgi:hypothetical protein
MNGMNSRTKTGLEALRCVLIYTALGAIQAMVFVLIYQFVLDWYASIYHVRRDLNYGVGLSLSIYILVLLAAVNAGFQMLSSKATVRVGSVIACTVTWFLCLGWLGIGIASSYPNRFLLLASAGFMSFLSAFFLTRIVYDRTSIGEFV